MDMYVLINIVCALVGMLIGLITFNRNRDKDMRNDASQSASESAVIKTKLDNINSGVESIRIDIKASEKRVNELTERMVRVEESTKRSHQRIDSLEGGN